MLERMGQLRRGRWDPGSGERLRGKLVLLVTYVSLHAPIVIVLKTFLASISHPNF